MRIRESREENRQNIPWTEDDFIRFFHYMRESRRYKASSMWTTYSRLNNSFQSLTGQSLQQWPRLKMLLKQYESGYERKTANIFMRGEILEVMKAPTMTSPFWILRKAAIALAFCGGLRGIEHPRPLLNNNRTERRAVMIITARLSVCLFQRPVNAK